MDTGCRRVCRREISKSAPASRCSLSSGRERAYCSFAGRSRRIAQALDIPFAQFFAEGPLSREMDAEKPTDDELRLLTQIRRYATNLNDSDRKLLLAMIKRPSATPYAKSKSKILRDDSECSPDVHPG